MCAFQAADDLYGDGEEKRCVADAWDAVGVYDGDEAPMLDGITTTVVNTQSITTYYDLMGRIVDVPSKGVYIKNGKKYIK